MILKKMKTVLFLIFFLLINQKIITLPLTIGNVTQYPILFYIELKNGTKEPFIYPQSTWTDPLKDNYFISITWKDSMSDNIYTIDIEKQMPSMMRGGTLVISNKGTFIYDDKTKRNNIKAGNAKIVQLK